MRAGAALAFAVEYAATLHRSGRPVRSDGWFAARPGSRPVAEEVAESVVAAARRSTDERRVRHLGYLLAEAAVSPDLDADLVGAALRLAESLSWRQLALLAGVGRRDRVPLPMAPLEDDPRAWTAWAAREDVTDLQRAGLLDPPVAQPAPGLGPPPAADGRPAADPPRRARAPAARPRPAARRRRHRGPGRPGPPPLLTAAHGAVLGSRAVEPSVRVLAWQRTDENVGHSIARVERLPDGWVCHGSEVIAGPGATLACGFRVQLDASWATRTVEVWSMSRAGERRLRLTVDVGGRWWRDGTRAPDLDGCIDVDVAATPPDEHLSDQPSRRPGGRGLGDAARSPGSTSPT